MKLVVIIPIIFALAIFISFLFLKKKVPHEKFIKIMLIIGIIFSGLSIIAVCISFYYSGNKTQLYKLSVPVMILVLTVEMWRRYKKKYY